MVRTRAVRKTPAATKNPEAFIKQISQPTLTSAVSALFKDAAAFENKRREKILLKDDDEEEHSLLDNGCGDFYLVITFKVAPFKEKLRPVPIRLKHSLWKEGEHEVCLFVKDPQRKVKDYLEEHGSAGVTRVLGVNKLRKRYGTHEARRELSTMYDVFLADQRVAPMMPNLLGKIFIDSKLVPLAVNMRKNVVEAIRRTLHCTPFAPRQGTCTSVKIGRLGFTEQQIVENCLTAVEGVAMRCDGGWENVQSLGLKTSQSPTIQIYLSLPGEKGDVAGKKRKRDDGAGDNVLEQKEDSDRKGENGLEEKKDSGADERSIAENDAEAKERDARKSETTPTKRRRTTRQSVKEETRARTRSAAAAERAEENKGVTPRALTRAAIPKRVTRSATPSAKRDRSARKASTRSAQRRR